MGQGTLAFTKQMLRVIDLVELEEFDHLVAMLDLEAQKRIAINRNAKRRRTGTSKQTYTCA
jgi:hypothetical protein